MNAYAVEVTTREDVTDAEGRRLAADIADLGIEAPVRARVSRMYWLRGSIGREEVEALARRLLADAVSETWAVDDDALRPEAGESGWIAEIRLKPGVMDAVGDSVLKGARDLGVTSLESAATGSKVYLFGDLSRDEAERVCERVLVNDVIQTYALRPIAS